MQYLDTERSRADSNLVAKAVYNRKCVIDNVIHGNQICHYEYEMRSALHNQTTKVFRYATYTLRAWKYGYVDYKCAKCVN